MIPFHASPGDTETPEQRLARARHDAAQEYLATIEQADRNTAADLEVIRARYRRVEQPAWQLYTQRCKEAERGYQAVAMTPAQRGPATAPIEIPVYPADHRTADQARMPRRPEHANSQKGHQ